MLKSEIIAQASRIAGDFKLDPNLVLAVIDTESDWYPYAFRYESDWIDSYMISGFAQSLKISPTSELVLQSSSIGLMQVMGSNCRRMGFIKNLMEMTIPENSVNYGCKMLSVLSKKYGDLEDTISAYNAGSPIKNQGEYVNQKYVDEVKTAMARKPWLQAAKKE